ncbi:MAG: polysaccharide pyruvyl transferase family protein, partial [Acidimicrobiia bacterium]
DLVEVPTLGDGANRVPGLGDMRAAGAAEIARGVKRSVTSGERSTVAAKPPDRTAEARVPIAYVGLPGQKNLGDDAMLEAIRGLMPWAHIDAEIDEPAAVMLGGGTLLNAGGYYLNRIRRVDGPNRERLVFGTGMRSPDFWGITERIDDWEPFLGTAMSVGVRGPLSKRGLQEWGFSGDIEIVGDPALALTRPKDAASVEGRVVLSPLHTGGECWGNDDAAVLDAYASVARELHDAGHELIMLTAHPNDDRWAIEVMRASGVPDMRYVPGHADMPGALEAIASSELVIGERLHSVVLAAAMGTPFVAVEYRPKVRDFAASLEAETWCVRTDDIGSLGSLVVDRLASDEDHQEAVRSLRSRLEKHASDSEDFLCGET